MMSEISLWTAFSAGLLSFATPCVLPLVPVYLASLAGPEIFEPQINRRRLPIFLHSLSFVIGFSLIFTIVGAGIGSAGLAINPNSPLVRQISGSLLIVFGLFMMAALKIPWLNFEKRLKPSQSIATGYLRSLLTGAIFSVAWTPCLGPIQGSVLTLAWSSQSTAYGAYLLALYSLGLGLPFLIIGGAFDFIVPLLKGINRYSKWIYVFSGAILIIVGILILTTRLI